MRFGNTTIKNKPYKMSNLKFELIQYRIFRKFFGGSYYLISNWLPMLPFWSDTLITSCGGKALKEEHYDKSK